MSRKPKPPWFRPGPRESRRPPEPLPELLPHVGVVTLALDPSSTAIGWAVFRGDSLARCGVWRPRGRDLEVRCENIAVAVPQMIDEAGAEFVVIERTSGLSYKAERAKSLYALAYAQGVAVGAARSKPGVLAVHVVTEQQWTGRVPKKKRASRLAVVEPVYADYAPRDKGLDAADAVGVGRWHLDRIRVERLMRGAC